MQFGSPQSVQWCWGAGLPSPNIFRFHFLGDNSLISPFPVPARMTIKIQILSGYAARISPAHRSYSVNEQVLATMMAATSGRFSCPLDRPILGCSLGLLVPPSSPSSDADQSLVTVSIGLGQVRVSNQGLTGCLASARVVPLGDPTGACDLCRDLRLPKCLTCLFLWE